MQLFTWFAEISLNRRAGIVIALSNKPSINPIISLRQLVLAAILCGRRLKPTDLFDGHTARTHDIRRDDDASFAAQFFGSDLTRIIIENTERCPGWAKILRSQPRKQSLETGRDSLSIRTGIR